MATTDQRADESVFESYVRGLRVVEREASGETTYRFEAPRHEGRVFDDPQRATLYAAVYVDVNGFEEAGTGDRGVPPVIIGAGRDTLAAYLLTLPGIDRHWVASFFGEKPPQVDRYAERVRARAAEILSGAKKRGVV